MINKTMLISLQFLYIFSTALWNLIYLVAPDYPYNVCYDNVMQVMKDILEVPSVLSLQHHFVSCITSKQDSKWNLSRT